MGKSVYSVVLDDDVVAALDLAAMRAGTNRSAMMNRLLAAQLQYATPEERIRTVLDLMEKLAENQYTALQVMSTEAESQLSLRSALRFKYNPTVKYCVELYAHSPDYLGVLRTQLRTQNALLTRTLERFYRLWSAMEQQVLHTPPGLYAISGARFQRVLRLPAGECTERQMADRLTRYVSMLDGCMKLFFEHADDPAEAARVCARCWHEQADESLCQL